MTGHSDEKLQPEVLKPPVVLIGRLELKEVGPLFKRETPAVTLLKWPMQITASYLKYRSPVTDR